MTSDRQRLERLWGLATGGLALLLAVGALVFPRTVYDRFLWQYFWGPVEADGRGLSCVARADGETYVPETCAEGMTPGVVAEPGYTVVSTVGYAVVLLLLLVGVYFLIDRLDVADDRSFVYAIVPFVFLGGALRTVEDASIAMLEATGTPALPFPYTAAIISPFIYFLVFGLTVGALVVSVHAARRGIVRGYEKPLGLIGTAALVVTVGYLAVLSATTDVLTADWLIPAITLGGATLIAGGIWALTERYAPVVNAGTGRVGAVIVWGHAVDGIANVLTLDWIGGYTPKHVVNAGVRNVTRAIQPAWLSDTIGITWPFLPLKVAVATGIVWLFDDRMLEESPRYTVLLLVVVLAVGLGPGTRDFLRATLGI